MDLAHSAKLRIEVATTVGEAAYPPGATFGPRTLHDYEMALITAGDCQWESQGRVVAAPPGTVLLNRKGLTDFYRWDLNDGCVRDQVAFGVRPRFDGKQRLTTDRA